jgi:hypothetical protein
MPFPNWHSGRVKNPNLFSSIKVLQKLSNGIMIYGGPLKSNPRGNSEVQTYRFPKSKFTAAEAKQWMREHDIKWISFESAVNTQSFNVTLFSTRIQSFTQNQIIDLIPANTLAEIKAGDPHPFFSMYSVCHEGESTPIVMDENGNKEKVKPITWTRKAIQSIKNIITKGIKLFKGHNKDSSHVGRRVIGKVIHSFEREIDGVLHHVFIAYHPHDVREEVKTMDVCSQEAKWNIIEQAGKLVAGVVDSITGIALASSEEEMPAFSGARRLGYVQAFTPAGNAGINNRIGDGTMGEPNNQNDPNNQGQNQGQGGNQGQQNQNFNNFGNQQGQNFGNQQGNQNFGNQGNQGNQGFNNFGNQGNQGNQNFGNQGNQQGNQNYANQRVNPPRRTALSFHELKDEVKRMNVFPSQLFTVDEVKRDREFATFFNQLEIMEEEKKKVDAKVVELQRQNELSTAKGRIDNIFKENKIPEELVNFISQSFEEDKAELADLTDKGLENYVSKQTKVFQRTAKIVDPEYDVEKKSGDGKGGIDGKDLTKAANNPLLEEDLDID